MVIFSENPRISFPVNMSPKVLNVVQKLLNDGKCRLNEFDAT